MQTTRISFRSGAPTTDYYHGADIVAQSPAGNYTVVRVSATAYNRGNSSSVSNYNGAHTAAIDGYAGAAQFAGKMASGYPTNALRWDTAVDIAVGHDAAGNMGGVTLRQTVSGWFSNVQTAYFGGFPRIPKRPSIPGTPVASDVLPTSLRLTWTASTDNAGSAIDGYLVRRWDNPEGTGSYVDSFENNLTRVLTGLTPGKQYRFVVYAHNNSYDQYSVASTAIVVRTLSGMWTKWEGAWKRTVPFVKVAGVWRAVSVFVKDAGVWKRGG